MTSGISWQGTDFDSLYAPIGSTTAGSNVNYKVSNTDIAARYASLSQATAANGFLSQRIPPIGNTSSGTDLSNLLVGISSLYSLTSAFTATRAMSNSPNTFTCTATATFASASAMTSFFTYGGRIMIAPTDTSGGSYDASLNTMLSTYVGTVVLYDQGCYVTGTAANTTVGTAVGALNITAVTSGTAQSLVSAHEGSYTNVVFTVSVYANAAPGSATTLTFTIVLTFPTQGSQVDSYTGNYNIAVSERAYAGGVGYPGSAQVNPTWSHSGP